MAESGRYFFIIYIITINKKTIELIYNIYQISCKYIKKILKVT